MRGDRVAKIGDPARAGDPFDRCTDQVHGVRRRRRDDDVDALRPRDANRGRDGCQVPGDVLIRHQDTPRERAGLPGEPVEAAAAVQLVGELPGARAEIARAVDPGLGRWHGIGIRVDPLRIVRCQHVRLDPVGGEMRRELERPLHAAAS